MPVSLTDLYRYPTIRSLASALATEDRQGGSRSGVERANRRLDRAGRRGRQ
jgi:hypothetical protein